MRFPATDIEFAMQEEIDTLRAENERLRDGWDEAIKNCNAFYAENERLREALQEIVDGIPVVRAKPYRDDGVISKLDYCPHNLHVYEECSMCIEDFARAALHSIRAAPEQKDMSEP